MRLFRLISLLFLLASSSACNSSDSTQNPESLYRTGPSGYIGVVGNEGVWELDLSSSFFSKVSSTDFAATRAQTGLSTIRVYPKSKLKNGWIVYTSFCGENPDQHCLEFFTEDGEFEWGFVDYYEYEDPSISPDGSLIAFRVERQNEWLLALADMQTRQVIELYPMSRSYSKLHWTADNKLIFEHNGKIAVTKAGSVEFDRYYELPIGYTGRVHDVAVSPDGSTIVYCLSDNNVIEGTLVFLVRVNGRVSKILARDKGQRFGISGLTWSPNSDYVAMYYGGRAVGTGLTVEYGGAIGNLFIVRADAEDVKLWPLEPQSDAMLVQSNWHVTTGSEINAIYDNFVSNDFFWRE